MYICSECSDYPWTTNGPGKENQHTAETAVTQEHDCHTFYKIQSVVNQTQKYSFR